MLFFLHTPSYFVLGVAMTKLPVFLLGMDSIAVMIFPAGLFHRTHVTIPYERGLGKE
jgi:hypothetical protein